MLRIEHLCVPKTIASTCHVSFLAAPDADNKHKCCLSPISPTSHIFPTVSPSQTSLMILNPPIPCSGPQQSGGATQIPSLTELTSSSRFSGLAIVSGVSDSGNPPDHRARVLPTRCFPYRVPFRTRLSPSS